MIYLIGGSSHVGKTLLAQKLLEQYHIPTLSLDHLKMMFIRGHLTTLTVYDDYKMRYFLWPYAAEFIKTAIENDQNLIVEGCYIPSEWREAFKEGPLVEKALTAGDHKDHETLDGQEEAGGQNPYLQKIRAAFIVMSEGYLREHEKDLSKYASVIEHRVEEELDLHRLINCSREFEEECLQENIPVLKIDGPYDVEALTKQLAKLLEMEESHE